MTGYCHMNVVCFFLLLLMPQKLLHLGFVELVMNCIHEKFTTVYTAKVKKNSLPKSKPRTTNRAITETKLKKVALN